MANDKARFYIITVEHICEDGKHGIRGELDPRRSPHNRVSWTVLSMYRNPYRPSEEYQFCPHCGKELPQFIHPNYDGTKENKPKR